MELPSPPPPEEVERFMKVLSARLERACSIDELLGYLTLMLYYSGYKLSKDKCFTLRGAAKQIALWYDRPPLQGLYVLGVELIDRLNESLFPTLAIMIAPGEENHIIDYAVSLSNEIDMEFAFVHQTPFIITGENGKPVK